MSDEYLNGQDFLPDDLEYENLSVDELIAAAKADLPRQTDPQAVSDLSFDVFDSQQITDVLDSEFPPELEAAQNLSEEDEMCGKTQILSDTRRVPELDPVTGMELLSKPEKQASAPLEEPRVQEVLPDQKLPEDDDFEPDFGSAFDDYGEYGEPENEEPEITPEEPPAKVKSKRHRIPTLVRVLLYFAITIGIGIGLGLFGWECAQDVLALGMKDTEVSITIQKDDNIDTVTEKLYENGLIRHKWLFKLYCNVTDAEEKIDPGVYTLNNLYDYHALVEGMIEYSSSRETVTVMITEGYDCEQIFALLEDNNVCSADELREAAQHAAFDFWFLEEVTPDTANRLEGFLYPDTYEFYIQDDADHVLQKMLNNFDRKLSDYRDEIEQSGFTVRQIINIAAMIEEEAANNDERGAISSVIYNRLASDDLRRLQMDSTVFYACQIAGTQFDITIDSPYNTYYVPGLPYGPISNPGLYSIKAALRPAETDYLYFAAGKDGVSHFYTDFEEFNAFVNSDQYIGYTGNDE